MTSWLLLFFFTEQKSSDEMKDFFKSLQKSFRRKKKPSISSTSPPPQEEKKTKKSSLVPTRVGGAEQEDTDAPPTGTNESKGKTWSSSSLSRGSTGVRFRGSSSNHGGGEHHPGRRFTVTEDMTSAWSRGGEGGEGRDIGGQESRADSSRRYR